MQDARGRYRPFHSGIGAVAAAALLAAGVREAAPALAIVGLLVGVMAILRYRGRGVGGWAVQYVAFALRAREIRADDVLAAVCPGAKMIDLNVPDVAGCAFSDGYGWTAAFEISTPGGAVHSAGLVVPDVSASTRQCDDTIDAPTERVRTLVALSHPRQRVFVTVRVGGDGIAWTEADLRPALTAALARIQRRLTAVGVPHRLLDASELREAVAWALGDGATLGDGVAPGPGQGRVAIDEAWDHLRVNGRWQATMHLPLSGQIDSDLLTQLAARRDATIALSALGSTLSIRLGAETPRGLAVAIAELTRDRPASHAVGQQLAALRETLPIGLPDVLSREPRSARQHPVQSRAGGRPHAVALPPAGLYLGRGRRGEAIYARLHADQRPLRVAVVGGPVAARVLADRARVMAAPVSRPSHPSVPVTITTVDRPTAADTAILTSADVVVCQPMSSNDALVVAGALGLVSAAEWLSRIEGDMVAVISDGVVKWLRLSVDQSRTTTRPRPPTGRG